MLKPKDMSAPDHVGRSSKIQEMVMRNFNFDGRRQPQVILMEVGLCSLMDLERLMHVDVRL